VMGRVLEGMCMHSVMRAVADWGWGYDLDIKWPQRLTEDLVLSW
jgi:hypothetical protein